MMYRSIVMFWALTGLGSACDCIRLPVKEAKRAADVVFRGTVVAVHESKEHSPVAIFRVARVWKGNVGETFEMHALQEVQSCLGFLPRVEVGADFLVYAHHLVPSDPDYFPMTCQTELAARAKDQIEQLGFGRKPKKSK